MVGRGSALRDSFRASTPSGTSQLRQLLGSAAAALLNGRLGTAEIERGVDEPDMAERLREVAQHPPRLRFVFLCKQPDVVAQRQEALEQGASLGVASLQDIVVGQPETAG